jgi:hypothetical protein
VNNTPARQLLKALVAQTSRETPLKEGAAGLGGNLPPGDAVIGGMNSRRMPTEVDDKIITLFVPRRGDAREKRFKLWINFSLG